MLGDGDHGSGIEIADEAKQRGMQVVVVTGHGLQFRRELQRHQRLLKPIRSDELVRAVAICASSRLDKVVKPSTLALRMASARERLEPIPGQSGDVATMCEAVASRRRIYRDPQVAAAVPRASNGLGRRRESYQYPH